jgi:hypothetical protein
VSASVDVHPGWPLATRFARRRRTRTPLRAGPWPPPLSSHLRARMRVITSRPGAHTPIRDSRPSLGPARLDHGDASARAEPDRSSGPRFRRSIVARASGTSASTPARSFAPCPLPFFRTSCPRPAPIRSVPRVVCSARLALSSAARSRTGNQFLSSRTPVADQSAGEVGNIVVTEVDA